MSQQPSDDSSSSSSSRLERASAGVIIGAVAYLGLGLYMGLQRGQVDPTSRLVLIASYLVMAAVVVGVVAVRLREVPDRVERIRKGHCPWCGYDLRASPVYCPECGAGRIDPEAPLTWPPSVPRTQVGRKRAMRRYVHLVMSARTSVPPERWGSHVQRQELAVKISKALAERHRWAGSPCLPEDQWRALVLYEVGSVKSDIQQAAGVKLTHTEFSQLLPLTFAEVVDSLLAKQKAPAAKATGRVSV
jgi:hypothetical protein